MSLKVEKLDGSMAKLTIEVDAAEVEKAITKAYNKVKKQISLPGFRRGKVPQKLVEKEYGVEVFFEDAANFMINDTYPAEVKECDLEIVSTPEIDVETLERGKNFVYTATVAIEPPVELGEYKGLEYVKADVEVTDEDVDKEVERNRELNSRRVPVEDRPVADGDIVNLNFEGFVDDKPFDGGKGEDYSLTIGSNTFIPGFEEQIIGHNANEEFDVNVTFPEDYQAEDLAGKAAVFKCKVTEIKCKELPPLDDEFASEVSEFDTLEEYKADIRKNMIERKEEEHKKIAQEALLAKAVENAKMELPEPMVNTQAEQTARDFGMRLENSGINMSQYLQMVGQTPEQFMEEVKPVAIKNIKDRLTLKAIAAAENLEVTDEEVENEIAETAKAYGMEVDKLKEFMSDEEKDAIKKDLSMKKASDFLYENGKPVDKIETETTEEKAEEKTEE